MEVDGFVGGEGWGELEVFFFFFFFFFRSNTGARAGLVIEGVSIRRRAFFRGAKIARFTNCNTDEIASLG